MKRIWRGVKRFRSHVKQAFVNASEHDKQLRAEASARDPQTNYKPSLLGIFFGGLKRIFRKSKKE